MLLPLSFPLLPATHSSPSCSLAAQSCAVSRLITSLHKRQRLFSNMAQRAKQGCGATGRFLDSTWCSGQRCSRQNHVLQFVHAKALSHHPQYGATILNAVPGEYGARSPAVHAAHGGGIRAQQLQCLPNEAPPRPVAVKAVLPRVERNAVHAHGGGSWMREPKAWAAACWSGGRAAPGVRGGGAAARAQAASVVRRWSGSLGSSPQGLGSLVFRQPAHEPPTCRKSGGHLDEQRANEEQRVREPQV